MLIDERDAESGTKVHRRGREVFQAVALQIVLTMRDQHQRWWWLKKKRDVFLGFWGKLIK
jgi:hypothetical protein